MPGIALAWVVCLALDPLRPTTLLPAALGTLLVTALGAWIVARFEHLAEVRIAVVGGPGTARELAHELDADPDRRLPRRRLDRPRHARARPRACAGSARSSEMAAIVARERIDLIVDGGGETARRRASPTSASASTCA